MELHGKTALLTGGRRVGQSVAEILARQGMNLVLTYKNSRDAAEEAVRKAKACGAGAVAVRADLACAREVGSVIETALRSFGGLDALIHMASTFRRIEFQNLTEQDWDEEINNNLKAAFLCGKAAADVMLKAGAGKIIFITDWAVLRPYKHYLPYLVAKGGVHTLTLALARELAPMVQVNSIAPGPVLFPDDFPPEAKEREINKTLLKREGSPSDVANAALFLLRDADFTTGSCIYVDGGKLIA